ncbi:MAG: hypothetical protein NC078_09700 [Ruminococcus sp.]|nr:hypothetical protein [Ruminococcus sp.]
MGNEKGNKGSGCFAYFGKGLVFFLMYHMTGYVINLPYRSFTADMLALAGLLLISFEDIIIKLKYGEHRA